MKRSALAAQPVDGVLLLDKPVGITSHAAIQRIKRLLLAAKAGHVGTLDPLASGLLPVCLGEATKFSTDAFGADKRYDAEILLGVTTTTGDTEGEVASRGVVAVSRNQVESALQQFTGAIGQTPPMYSALKRNGKRLYAYARAGQSVALQPRNIVIHELILRGFDSDRVRVSVHCSKGTYIRVLAEDIGRVLACGATLAALRRVAVGKFEVTRAVRLEQLEALPPSQRSAMLLPVDSLVSALPEIMLDAGLVQRMATGQAGQVGTDMSSGTVRLYDRNRRFLGLGEVQPGGRLVPKRLMATAATRPTEP